MHDDQHSVTLRSAVRHLHAKPAPGQRVRLVVRMLDGHTPDRVVAAVVGEQRVAAGEVRPCVSLRR